MISLPTQGGKGTAAAAEVTGKWPLPVTLPQAPTPPGIATPLLAPGAAPTLDIILQSHYFVISTIWEAPAMKSLTVRNIPNPLYERLVRLAALNRRSLQQQLLVILEGVPSDPDNTALKRAASIRKRLTEKDLGDTVSEVREVRSR